MAAPAARKPWLPDLCRLPRLAVLLGVAELVVLLLALAPDGGAHWNLARFASASGFALWLALTVAVMLCVSRGWLSRPAPALGAALALAAAAAIAALGAGMVFMINASFGYGLVPGNVSVWRFMAGSAAMVALIIGIVLRYFYVFDRWQAQVRASARAETDALQARIRPHFLFNSMNTIAGLVRRDPEVAERAVLDLSDLFRAALGVDAGNSTLAEEIELVERYLAIEALRLGPRLRVAWQRDPGLPLRLPMPRLVLQPLVENAVLHGVSQLPEGGCIEIGLHNDGPDLCIRIRNPARPPRERDSGGANHAQGSIGHRLAYAYGPEARMTAGWADGYYQCDIRIPTADGGAGR